ncbi:hypothetical protein BU17DRAFT_51433 [Hysterangium stoloniferum]|nr:hypothetical protein BU17DRAFT_51433 [Hysterangium stoloniferum]
MRITFLFLPFLLALSSASWFSPETPEYRTWDKKKLEGWLKEHDINVPKTFSQEQLQALVKVNWYHGTRWTKEQYNAAQKAFENVKDDSFNAWDESKLRQFLLDQGIVAPKGPKEQLVQSAKSVYSSYTAAASSYSSRVSDAASTVIHGDKFWQASKSAASASSVASSVAAQATQALTRKLDDTKDYVYSTWDDNRMRKYLEEKGVIEPKQKTTRSELLAYMHAAYAAVANPIWEAWSDSYMHEWLVHHGIIRSDFEKNRDALRKQMEKYYYDANERVWLTWTNPQLRDWLVKHKIIKPESNLTTDRMRKIVHDNYVSAADTLYAGWHDNEMRTWLIEHGYLRSDAQVKRDELVKLFNDKYNYASTQVYEYITWPDARLRVFLRNHGVSDSSIPWDRQELLHEVRHHYTRTYSSAGGILSRILSSVYNGIELVERKVGQFLSAMSGMSEEAKVQAHKANLEAAKCAEVAARSAESVANSLSTEAAKASARV